MMGFRKHTLADDKAELLELQERFLKGLAEIALSSGVICGWLAVFRGGLV